MILLDRGTVNGKFEVTCKHCKNSFYTNEKRKVFCDRSCSATFNNLRRGNKPMVKCQSPLCSRKIFDRGNNQKYCASQCRQADLLRKWFDGEWVPEAKEFPSWLREFLIIGGCSKCQWNEVNPLTGRSPVQIDHINGNSSDHSRKNIQALCPNCHSLTTTYGALNKGRGRKHRYKVV